MKRARTSPSHKPHSECLLHALPREIVSKILVPLYGWVPQLPGVCHTWRNILLIDYKDWFALAQQLYGKHELLDRLLPHHINDPNATPLRLSLASECPVGHAKHVYGSLDNDVIEPHTVVVSHPQFISGWPLHRSKPRLGHDRLVGGVHRMLLYLDKYVTDQASRPFREFIGRLLVAKYPHYELWESESILNQRDRLFDTTYDIECRMLQALLYYVETEGANVLVQRNFHWRDVNIQFTEQGHQYTLYLWDPIQKHHRPLRSYRDLDDDEVCGTLSFLSDEDRVDTTLDLSEGGSSFYRYWEERRDLCSMTTFIGSLYAPFDADEAIAVMKINEKKWNNPRENKYFGMSDDAIKKQWTDKCTTASVAGTAMHLNLERRYLGRKFDPNTKELAHYLKFERDHVEGKLRPYRAEWMLWDEELMWCGSADIIFEHIAGPYVERDSNGKKHLIVGDYKRCEHVDEYNSWQSGLEGTGAEFAGNCSYVRYAIQTYGGYKYMLEKSYDVVVDEVWLIVLHPDQKTYIRIVVYPSPYQASLDTMMGRIIEYRKRRLAEYRSRYFHNHSLGCKFLAQ